MKVLAVVIGSSNEAWRLIIKIALTVLVSVMVVGFMGGCSSGSSLNEHSSCKDFEQADTDTQNQVLQDMMTAHGSKGSLSTTRLSVELYCQFHDQNNPIDGIYNSSGLDKQPAQARHIVAPLTVWVYSNQTWSKAAGTV